ncbi:MAG: hypothetical protein U0931_10480 [Vulcanimicrobiota bacterium]
MSTLVSRRLVIDNHPFQLNFEHKDETWKIRVQAELSQDHVLANILQSCFIYGVDHLLRAVANREGQSFEGAVAYCYADEEPEVTPGNIGLSYLDEEAEVPENLFRNLVSCAAALLLEIIDREGQPEPAWAKLLDQIDQES